MIDDLLLTLNKPSQGLPILNFGAILWLKINNYESHKI